MVEGIHFKKMDATDQTNPAIEISPEGMRLMRGEGEKTVVNRPERGGARVWSPEEMNAIRESAAKADAAAEQARRERQNAATQVVRERTPKQEPKKKGWLSKFLGG